MNRIEMLKEMGISPVWAPRKASAPALEPVEPVDELVDAGKPLVGADAGGNADRNGSRSGSQGRPPQKMTLAPAGAPSIARPAPASVDPERAALIARLDWPQLREAVASCQSCMLCKGRNNTVFGVGDEQADWMIIGEAPGQEEDRLGEPFVGQAGKLLDSMLAALDMQRNVNVFIANVLKCRPPGNRNPEEGEMAQCSPHLVRQVELVAPKVILLMGRFAVQSILQTDKSIASLRGKLYQYRGIPAVVTYHPAYLLRTLPDKAKAWEDLLFARSVYAGVGGS